MSDTDLLEVALKKHKKTTICIQFFSVLTLIINTVANILRMNVKKTGVRDPSFKC